MTQATAMQTKTASLVSKCKYSGTGLPACLPAKSSPGDHRLPKELTSENTHFATAERVLLPVPLANSKAP